MKLTRGSPIKGDPSGLGRSVGARPAGWRGWPRWPSDL